MSSPVVVLLLVVVLVVVVIVVVVVVVVVILVICITKWYYCHICFCHVYLQVSIILIMFSWFIEVNQACFTFTVSYFNLR